MANVQLDDGYVRIANTLATALALAPWDSASQPRLVMALIQTTFGMNRKAADIGMAQWRAMTGMHDRQVRRAKESLQKAGVITLVHDFDARFQTPQRWQLNKDYETWGKYAVSVDDVQAAEDHQTVTSRARVCKLVAGSRTLELPREPCNRMRTFLRRLRGIAGIGLAWCAAWGAAGALLGIAQWLILSTGDPGLRMPLIGLVVAAGLVFATYGLLIGAMFGTILAVAERSRKLEQLSKWRIAAWGCIAGGGVLFMNIVAVRLIEGGVLSDGPIAMILSAGLGAVSAAATLNLARSAGSHSANTPEALGNADGWKLPAAELELLQERSGRASAEAEIGGNR